MKAGLLEVNTRTASALRFVFRPKGAKVEKFSKDDLAVFKRALRWQRKRAAEKLLNGERVSKCYVTRIKSSVEVYYSERVKRAHYGGLMVCGSVWHCPICAAKITERRRVELESAKVGGLSMFMVTVTFQHGKKDKLENLINDLISSWRIVTSGRAWQRVKKRFSIVGSITGREVTYGPENGWHPHLHILYYSRLPISKINDKLIKRYVYARLKVALAGLGRYVSFDHGVKVTMGKNLLSQYAIKSGLEDEKKNTWSLVSEITKAPAKSGMKNGDHYTPFQLLDFYICGDLVAGSKFIEYAKAMKGRKQLTYSKDLRGILGLEKESSDQETAEAQDQQARRLSYLSAKAWKIILTSGKRGTLLEVASSGNYKLFRTYCLTLGIDDLPEMEP